MSEPAIDVFPSRPAWLLRVPSQRVASARSHGSRIPLALAAAGYLGFACYLTWPLVTNLSHLLYGGSGDPYGTIAFYRDLVEQHLNPFLPGTNSHLAAPAGIPVPWPRDLASAPGTLTLYLLTMFFGAIPAYGLYALAGYTLTGTVTFMFAHRLTHNTWVAAIAGWVYAFYPFAAINGHVHPDFVQGWLFVLVVWRMVELMWHPSRRNGVLAGLATVLCMWWSPYFVLFGGMTYAVVAAVTLLIAWRNRSLRTQMKPQTIAAVIVCVFAAALGVLSITGESEGIGVRTHTTAELGFYAARPLEYLLPDVQSPLLGSDTRPYLASYPHEGTGFENTLYVGITIVALALIALAACAARRLGARLRSVVIVLSALAAVAAVTSMPPEARILGAEIPLPAHFIAGVTSTWRVYSRLVIVVMLAMTLLAAVGLDVLARRRARWLNIALMSLATIAIPLDLWAPQHADVEKIDTQTIYETLARQPPGLVASYPLIPAEYGNKTYRELFYQGIYKMPLLNGYQEDTPTEALALSASSFNDPTTAARLATLGVRYVINEPRDLEGLSYGVPGVGFRLIAHQRSADLYVVTAHSLGPVLAGAGAGFVYSLTETGIDSWLTQRAGTLDVVGKCTTCSGVLTMTLLPGHGPHKVSIVGSTGQLLTKGTVASPTGARIELRFSRHTSLKLIATPVPAPSNGLEPPNVSVGVTDLVFSAVTPESGRSDHNARRRGRAR
jgi:hypothetical protein